MKQHYSTSLYVLSLLTDIYHTFMALTYSTALRYPAAKGQCTFRCVPLCNLVSGNPHSAICACQRRCEKVYIGQTGRTLEHKMKEHRRALTSGNLAQSALAEHAADRGHAIDWRSAEVVDSHQQFHQRCLLES